MAITYNGSTVNAVAFNGTDAEIVTYNGTEVWRRTPPTPTELDLHLTSELTADIYLTSTDGVTVDWGDGDTVTPVGGFMHLTHTYAAAGDYTVEITAPSGGSWYPGGNETVEGTTTNYSLMGSWQIDKSASYPTLTAFRGGDGMTLDQYTAGFYGCTGLVTVTIPEGITALPSFCCYGCTSLVSLSIPSTVTVLYGASIYGCTSLVSLTIPAAVTDMSEALGDVTALATLRMLPTTPPTVAGAADISAIPSTCTVYVPVASVTAYQTAEYWSEIASQIVADT